MKTISRKHVKLMCEIAARNVEEVATSRSPQIVASWLMNLVMDLQCADGWTEDGEENESKP